MVHFYVTGFGKFGGVEDNPAQRVVEALAELQADGGLALQGACTGRGQAFGRFFKSASILMDLAGGATLSACVVLRVAADAVTAWLMAAAQQQSVIDMQQAVVWVRSAMQPSNTNAAARTAVTAR
jgi:hypothetical protein